MTEKQREQINRLSDALTDVFLAGRKRKQYDQEKPGTEEVYPDVTLEDACDDNLVDMTIVMDVDDPSANRYCRVPSIFFELDGPQPKN